MKSKRALRRHHLNRIKQLALEQAKALFPSQRALWVSQMGVMHLSRLHLDCRPKARLSGQVEFWRLPFMPAFPRTNGPDNSETA
jgi:hypothetical protein